MAGKKKKKPNSTSIKTTTRKINLKNLTMKDGLYLFWYTQTVEYYMVIKMIYSVFNLKKISILNKDNIK